MAIIKINNYTPGKNLTSLALNVDYNRLGEDKSQITVNFGTVPATVTIKRGSIFECNGNRYLINGADYSFQMANATHNYITFTDNPAISFGSAAAIGTYDAEKLGHYQADNLTRTLKFYIDQTAEDYFTLIDCILPDLTISTMRYDKIKVGLSANQATVPGGPFIINFDTAYSDLLSNFDTMNYKYICPENGYYYISIYIRATSLINAYIYLNGVSLLNVFRWEDLIAFASILQYLESGDEISIYYSLGGGAGVITSGEENTNLSIFRLL